MPKLNHRVILVALETHLMKLHDNVTTYARSGNMEAVDIFKESIKQVNAQIELVVDIIKAE